MNRTKYAQLDRAIRLASRKHKTGQATLSRRMVLLAGLDAVDMPLVRRLQESRRGRDILATTTVRERLEDWRAIN